MKPKSFLLLILLCLTVTFACNKDEITPLETSYGILQYFGFTLIDVGWDDPSDTEIKTNYTDEVRDFTNIADILVIAPNDDIRSRLQIMDDAELQVILNIFFLLFEKVPGTAPSGNKYQPYPDYQARFDQFVSTNDLKSDLKNIRALYIGEEPTWNGISSSDLQAVCDYIKLRLPEPAIMIIEAFPILDEFIVPSSADWIGFDQYFIKNPDTNSSYQANLRLLKSKIATNQQIVMVMDTHHYQLGHQDQGGISASEMGEVATNYYYAAGRESNVIAVLGYYWPNGFDDPNALGARGMSSDIRMDYERIGKGITGK